MRAHLSLYTIDSYGVTEQDELTLVTPVAESENGKWLIQM